MKKVLIVLPTMLLMTSCMQTELVEEPVPAVERIVPAVEVSYTEPVIEVVEEIAPAPIEYRVTGYCSCEKCCGKWSLNRPLDENGNEIVYGASGAVLESGVSSGGTLPFGTQVELEGYGTVVVQDRGADWLTDKFGENWIDIYFSSHEEAKEFGLQYLNGVIVE